MEFEPINKFSEDNLDDSINFREVLEKYLIHIKWFVLCVLVFLVLTFLYLRKEVPKYEISAKILIKDNEKGSTMNELSSFESMGIFGSNNNSLENEIHVLTSRRLMKKVAHDLKLNIQYFIEDDPYNKEQFPNFPLNLSFGSPNDSIEINEKQIDNIENLNTFFSIKIIDSDKFEYFDEEEEMVGVYYFGKEFKANFGKITIGLDQEWRDQLVGRVVIVSIRKLDRVVDRLNNLMVIEPVDEKSRVIGLTLKESIPERGIAIINNLIEQYNADGINDKNIVGQATIDFLDERLNLLSTELVAIESTAEQFKTRNRMVDASSGAGIFLQSSSTNESELVGANTQLQLVNYMLEELKKSGTTAPLPGNIGLAEPGIVNMISEYNNLILQRNRILKSSSTINPIIVNIDSQLEVLKNNLRNSLQNQQYSVQLRVSALNNQGNRIGSQIASVPRNEREYKDIVRQQETKNALYLFLLQKREESILSSAVSVEKAKIIDRAYTDGFPVSPKPGLTYFAALLMGLLLPAGVIYIKDFLDTKVHSEKDIKKLRIPYLGDVPLSKSVNNLFIKDGDNTNIAEAFRYIRTNINFMLDSKEMGKTVFVTSTQSHEGKTFTAINLATSLAISGKKTLLLALDLRAPKVNKYLALQHKKGVTNFITDKTIAISDIIHENKKLQNLHILNSGDIPPNPVELLMSKRVNEIFEEVKKLYEYIIVDTAPVGMVTDTIQIAKYADMTMYVIKANYLDKRMLHIPEKLYKENKLINMAIIINGSDHSKGAYGYGYGYGYGNKKNNIWYHKILKSAAI